MKEPVRVIEGNAKPHERFWNVRNEEGGDPSLEFYGVISEYSWFDDDISPRMFKKDLYNLGKNGPITVHIDSPGGDVDAASAIRAIMMDYPGKITTKIDGMCLSAAVTVAMAGDHVMMQESGSMMIHDPWTIAMGGAEDMKSAAKMLEECKAGIIDCYETRTQLDRAKLAKMMSDTTWMNARTAKELGFIDEIITASAKANNLAKSSIVNCLKNYEHVPEDLLAEPDAEETPVESDEPVQNAETPATSNEPEEGTDELEVKSLLDYLDVFSKGAK